MNNVRDSLIRDSKRKHVLRFGEAGLVTTDFKKYLEGTQNHLFYQQSHQVKAFDRNLSFHEATRQRIDIHN